MTDTQRKVAARKFAKEWKGTWSEKQHTQSFWNQLLHDVFGVDDTKDYIEYERKVQIEDSHGFIDGYINKSKVLIEQKNSGKSLSEKEPQSDGKSLTPYEQAERYDKGFPSSQKAAWIITCNFQEFYIYDREKPYSKPVIVKLEELADKLDSLKFLIDETVKDIQQELKISTDAGEIVGKLYDAILKQYEDPESDEAKRDINILCVRLVFCLYAEDAGIFGERLKFGKYLEQFSAEHTRTALIRLFRVLNQKPEERDKYLENDLASFPYVNGQLFEGEYEIPKINDEIRDILLRKASFGFDWSGINPTIFGAIFESTLSGETRKSGGMHYTTPENIHKVIDPLFLNDLTHELDTILANPIDVDRRKLLTKYQKKLSELTFLDPACGSGNFLTETYTSLRRLENKVIAELGRIIANSGELDRIKSKKHTEKNFYALEDQTVLGDKDWNPISPIKVSINQFYGIEINDFAVAVSKTALWIAESQMMKETEEIINQELDFLPLKTNAHIHEANALRLDWEDVVPKDELSYIIGNPPFSAGRRMDDNQRKDMVDVAYDFSKNGELDYVCLWYIVAARYMQGTQIKAGFVSTSSITQGEQVVLLWKTLFEKYHLNITYAVRSFNWQNDAKDQAGVHCVIIEFVIGETTSKKYIASGNKIELVNYINGYLTDTKDTWIYGQKKPLCNVPQISNGSKPLDNAICAFTPEEKEAFITKEPASAPYFYRYMGSREFINNIERWFLLINRIPTQQLINMPYVLKKLDEIKEYRLSSDSKPTQKLANTPAKFHYENMPDSEYLVIPQTSSGRRKYVPIGFLTPDVLVNNKLQVMRDGGLYEFGILSSNIHNAWLRTVAGRFREDFTYSVSVVYNTFPWCNPTDEQKAKIEKTAQSILDARAKYPDASLADMYGEHMHLYSELVKAHQANDAAVAEAYGIPKDMPEAEVVAMLMKRYQELTER